MRSVYGYLGRRLALSLLMLWLVSVLVFLFVRAIPGDPITAQGGTIALSSEEAQELRRQLGLDKPLVVQYLIWARDFLRGDGGRSIVHGNSTVENLLDALPVTLEIAGGALLGALLVAVPLGTLAAIRANRPEDYGARVFSLAGLSVPDFWLGTVILLYLAIWFGWTVPFGYRPPWEDPGRNLVQFAIPVGVLSLRLSASTLRFVRAGVLEVLREDYVRTATAKGLPGSVVIRRHALRNALIPVATVIGVQTAYLIGGAVVMETLFSLPGVGRLTLASLMQRDYTQLQTNIMFLAAMTVAINFVVDALYAAIDPRVRGL
ncbi:MAG TPA: ABC transporter permease [Dehalococcoidia bacterium]|nr:ABC transporter permease [Dehalococcoidia bacterium]